MQYSPIIQAIDVTNIDDALRLSKPYLDKTHSLKLGLEFFCNVGTKGVLEVAEKTGKNIFLDLKFHDIPQTVGKAVASCLPMRPFMMTIHIGGGLEMMKHAIIGAEKIAEKTGKKPLLIGVALLTSMDEDDLQNNGIEENSGDYVLRMAEMAVKAGIDGIVCSGKELGLIKSNFGDKLKTIIPGIRQKDSIKDDQKRTMSPEEATKVGADFLVIGRDISNIVK